MDFASFWNDHGVVVLVVMGILILIALIVSSVGMSYVLPLMYPAPVTTMANRNKARYSGQNASVYDMQAAALAEGGSIAGTRTCASDDPSSSSAILWAQLNSSLTGATTEDSFLTTASALSADYDAIATADLPTEASYSSSSSMLAAGTTDNASAAFTNRRRRR